MFSKISITQKMETLFLMLRMQAKLIALFENKNGIIIKIEENYENAKAEFFRIKILLNDNSLEFDVLQSQIQDAIVKLSFDRMQLLKHIPYRLDQNLISSLEKYFSNLNNADSEPAISKGLIILNLNKFIDGFTKKSHTLCAMKHRLLYFELKTLSSLTSILNYLTKFFANSVQINLKENLLEMSQQQVELAVQCYQAVDKFLNQDGPKNNLLIDKKLETQLAAVYSQRSIVQPTLSELLANIEIILHEHPKKHFLARQLKLMLEQLSTIEEQVDKINCLVNHTENISDDVRLNFINLLTESEDSAKELSLNYYYADIFSSAYRTQVIILLQFSWQEILHKNIELLKQQYSNEVTMNYVMAVKQLLMEYKNYHFEATYKTLKHNQVLQSLCDNTFVNYQADSKLAFQALLKQKQNSHSIIAALESNLSNYPFSLGIAASLVRLFKNNWYYRIAENYIKSSYELTLSETLKNLPIIGQRLTDSQLKFLSVIQTTVFVVIEVAVARSVGISYSLLASLIEYVMPNINTVIKAAKYINLDEIDAINSRAIINWLAGLHIQLLLHTMFNKTVGDILIPIGSYLSSSLVRQLTIQLINYANSQTRQKFHSSAVLNFGKFLAESGAHFLGHWLWLFAYPVLAAFLSKPTAQDLLRDPKLCKQYIAECEKITLNTLKLKQRVSPETIKEQFRNLVLEYHPDKNKGRDYVGSFFEDIRHAKQRALEIAGDISSNSIVSADSNKLMTKR